MNCPSCGAAVQDGKFCKYCGAKLPDDTKRVEVHIENVAEMKRADYETEESKLRQREMEAEFRNKKIKRTSSLIILCICTLFSVLGLIHTFGDYSGLAIIAGIPATFFASWHVIKLLVTGKW